MDAGIIVAGGVLGQRSRMAPDHGQFFGETVHPPLDGALVRFQPRIIGHKLRFLSHRLQHDASRRLRQVHLVDEEEFLLNLHAI